MIGGTHLSARVRSVIRWHVLRQNAKAAARWLARAVVCGGDELMSASGGRGRLSAVRTSSLVTPPAESLGLRWLAAEGFAAERRGA